MFFRFPPGARWNPQRSVVEFGIGGGEYEGMVRVSRRVFQLLLSEKPTPERFLEAYHLNLTGSSPHPAHMGVTENQHGRVVRRGTKGSNPLSSSGESGSNRAIAKHVRGVFVGFPKPVGSN